MPAWRALGVQAAKARCSVVHLPWPSARTKKKKRQVTNLKKKKKIVKSAIG